MGQTSSAVAVLVASLSGVASAAAAQPVPTFSRDVAPVLYAHCAVCHRPGGIAPFSLVTYEDVRPRAAAIGTAVRLRTMPPWKPEPGYGEFVGDRRLTAQQIDVIERWIAEGAPEGTRADVPPPPPSPDGWQFGRPDLVVTLPQAYTVPANGGDILRNFVIPIPLARTRYVTAVEFHPGNSRVVHHANMRIDPSARWRVLDNTDGQPGFDGRISAGSFPDGQFLGWTPGQLPVPAADTAWRLDPGSDLVLQLHLHATDRTELVQPSIGFVFTDTVPDRAPLMLRLGRHDLDIPPGATAYTVEDSYVLPADVEVLAVQPHAHYRAREIKGFAALPGGGQRWLLYIRDWDFNWQDAYRFRSPVKLPKGARLTVEFTYDNSATNRRNPDRPPRRIRWGENTTDEMGDLWLQVVTRTTEDRRRLAADFGPKVIAEDAAGYESELQVDPRNVRLHDAVAAIYLALGRVDEAVGHLTTALGIDPRFAPAHYNLAAALVSLDRIDEAAEHLRRAVELDPQFLPARVNLGAVLRRQKRYGEAVSELRHVLQIDPTNAVAHTNLAGIFAAEQRPADAAAEYRAALQANPDVLEALAGLTWLLATTPDSSLRLPDEAIRLGQRATTLTDRRDVASLDALAAAYASAARYEDAIAVEQEAVDIVERAGAAAAATELRRRLQLYRDRQPYRD